MQLQILSGFMRKKSSKEQSNSMECMFKVIRKRIIISIKHSSFNDFAFSKKFPEKCIYFDAAALLIKVNLNRSIILQEMSLMNHL